MRFLLRGFNFDLVHRAEKDLLQASCRWRRAHFEVLSPGLPGSPWPRLFPSKLPFSLTLERCSGKQRLPPEDDSRPFTLPQQLFGLTSQTPTLWNSHFSSLIFFWNRISNEWKKSLLFLKSSFQRLLAELENFCSAVFLFYLFIFSVFRGVSITERQYDCSYGICTPLSM